MGPGGTRLARLNVSKGKGCTKAEDKECHAPRVAPRKRSLSAKKREGLYRGHAQFSGERVWSKGQIIGNLGWWGGARAGQVHTGGIRSNKGCEGENTPQKRCAKLIRCDPRPAGGQAEKTM